mgnify:CR=1 FL=1
MEEIRCTRCGRLLAKAKFEKLEIKCPRCKRINYLKAAEPRTRTPLSVERSEADNAKEKTAKKAG